MRKSKLLMAIVEATYNFTGSTEADRKAGFAILKKAFDLERSRLTKCAPDLKRAARKSDSESNPAVSRG